jgi:hypothetical protein
MSAQPEEVSTRMILVAVVVDGLEVKAAKRKERRSLDLSIPFQVLTSHLMQSEKLGRGSTSENMAVLPKSPNC